MKKYELTEQMAQALLNYLVQQPYKEVAQLIQQMSQLTLTEKKADADADNKKPPQE